MRIIKAVLSFIFSRLFIVALMLIVQIALLVTVIIYFSQSIIYLYPTFLLLSLIVVMYMLTNSEHPDFKLTWVVSILVLPLIGGVFYLAFGNKRMPRKLKWRIERAGRTMHDRLPDNGLEPTNRQSALQSRYVYNLLGYPVRGGTSSRYFPVGEKMYQGMLEEMKRAKRYIFLEYFIIRPGEMWDGIFAILRDKAREGVEVYLMYDDIGSIRTVPKGFDRMVRNAGIKLCVFNPFRLRVSAILNYRDHRKITVIDGKVAFCGGINLADEYINRRDRLGHWKDTGVMLRGDAVWPFTLMFLQQWQFATGDTIDMENFRPEIGQEPDDGLVQVFGDSPLDRFNITETVYLNAITRAEKYIYITTPYLVIDYEMEQALCAAAATGVDVRIITPYRYDKWYVHMLTRSHYAKLIRAGVKIYEYTPGFMHGKMLVTDDLSCVVGTCNMDFRSFHLHFECSVLFYEAKLIADVKRDMLGCQEISHLVTVEEALNVPLHTRVIRAALKLFAPLM